MHSSLLQAGHSISDKRGDAICRAADDFQTSTACGTSSYPQIQYVGCVSIGVMHQNFCRRDKSSQFASAFINLISHLTRYFNHQTL